MGLNDSCVQLPCALDATDVLKVPVDVLVVVEDEVTGEGKKLMGGRICVEESLSRMPFWISSSRVARTDILRSKPAMNNLAR